MVVPSKICAILCGAWKHLNSSHTDLEGKPVPEVGLGTNPVGLLMYNPNGFMSATLMSSDPANRPPYLTWPPQANQSDSDWALVGRQTLSYAGPFSTGEKSNETMGQLIHGPLLVGSVPKMVGQPQERNYTMFHEEGENGEKKKVLQLSARNDTQGLIGYLWWVKLE